MFLSSKDLHHQKVACCQNVVNHVPSAILHRQLQKKGVGPVQSMSKIKVVKGVLCVNLLSSVPSVQNVPHVVTEISVEGRLQSFWQVWQEWGSNPRVVSVLRDGYSLPFRGRPHLSRFPLIVSKYASLVKSKALLEALASLIQKKAVEKVVIRSSLAFYNRLFLVLKLNNKWRPILDLSTLNLFLETKIFKIETPETIRLSLQQGEWVTSLDFSDAYFHIPIAQRSRKYLRFHLNKVNYQFKALPFGLATAPFLSLIGLLTATEKQVWLGRLHMRPIQWHLKRHWHVPESLEKVIPLPQSLHPHLDWWLLESNVLRGQSLHPLQHALQIFTDASNVGWGAHLGDSTARGVWSEPESRLHINFLELKAVFLALKSFEPLCKDQIVLIATNNTTVLSYINKEGSMRSGSLCALLWRLLSWCHPRQIVLRARHIPGRLNVIADKLS